jgi:ABC-type branched-subunit amino acid transport system substrate-binding protein
MTSNTNSQENKNEGRYMSYRSGGALSGLLLLFSITATSAAPNDDRSPMLRGLAVQAGRVLGAASACPNISRPRIAAIAGKITDVIRSSAPSADEGGTIVVLFNDSESEGARSVSGRQFDCALAERQLADLENASASSAQTGSMAAAVPQSAPPIRQAFVGSPASTGGVRGVSANEIRFGIAAPFSGPAKDLGQQMRVGIETAFRAANEAGGVNGRQLRLVAVDDGYEPARTSEAMKQLYEKDQVLGVIGNVGTPTAVVSVPFALDRQMLFFAPFTGAGLLRRDPPDRYVFNYRASYAEETDAVVRYLVKLRRIKPDQIAVFAQQDAFGDAGFAGVAKAMRALRGGDGGFILRIGYPRNTMDVDAAIAQLKAHKTPIKAIVTVGTYRAIAKFIERTREAYPGLIYTSVSFVGSTSLRDELMLLGPKYVSGVIVTQVVPAVDGRSTFALQYRSALSKYFGSEPPDYVSLEGYIDGQIIVEALRRAGPDLTTEKLVDTLEAMQGFDLGLGTPISFGKSEHQGSHKVWGTQLTEEGKFESLELQ